MSLSRLQKQLDFNSSVSGETHVLTKIPVVLSDSKARCVSNEVTRGVEKEIKWWWKGGASTQSQFQYLKDNLELFLHQHQNIVLYLWLGTCDLTVKQGKYISLRSKDNLTAYELINTFKDIYKFIKDFPTVELSFLELPPYSIYEYNKVHGNDNQEFREDDKLLAGQIDIVNSFVRETNILLRKSSPKFSLDLENCKKSHNKPSAYSYRFSTFYTDGVHPIPPLAKLWLYRICKEIVKDCVESQ